MWYDKYPGVPPRGSPLETVFVLVGLQRREEALMGTRALVLGSMADDRTTAQKAVEGFQEYCDTMFPFLKKASEISREEDRKRLLQHVQGVMRIDTGSIFNERAATARAKAARKYKIRKD